MPSSRKLKIGDAVVGKGLKGETLFEGHWDGFKWVDNEYEYPIVDKKHKHLTTAVQIQVAWMTNNLLVYGDDGYYDPREEDAMGNEIVGGRVAPPVDVVANCTQLTHKINYLLKMVKEQQNGNR